MSNLKEHCLRSTTSLADFLPCGIILRLKISSERRSQFQRSGFFTPAVRLHPKVGREQDGHKVLTQMPDMELDTGFPSDLHLQVDSLTSWVHTYKVRCGLRSADLNGGRIRTTRGPFVLNSESRHVLGNSLRHGF